MNHPFALTLAALQSAFNSESIAQDTQQGGGDPSQGDTLTATTLALGEEGGGITDSLSEGGDATTEATGEEGGDYTTFAVGEEGGDYTTFAVGEEGGDYTTFALGEEGGVVICGPVLDSEVITQALEETGGMTTAAIGEEGGEFPGGNNGIILSFENLDSFTALSNVDWQ